MMIRRLAPRATLAPIIATFPICRDVLEYLTVPWFTRHFSALDHRAWGLDR
jgi:hypothetical protein